MWAGLGDDKPRKVWLATIRFAHASKFHITQVVTVETMFHEENNQRARGRYADAEQYSLNVVR